MNITFQPYIITMDRKPKGEKKMQEINPLYIQAIDLLLEEEKSVYIYHSKKDIRPIANSSQAIHYPYCHSGTMRKRSDRIELL